MSIEDVGDFIKEAKHITSRGIMGEIFFGLKRSGNIPQKIIDEIQIEVNSKTKIYFIRITCHNPVLDKSFRLKKNIGAQKSLERLNDFVLIVTKILMEIFSKQQAKLISGS